MKFLVYVEDPDKINIVNLQDKEMRVRELVLPDGVRVKCPTLLDDEKNKNKLASNLA